MSDTRTVIYPVASGYDWICHECGKEQHEEAINLDVPDLTCQSCGANYRLGYPEHCYA